MKDGQGEPLNSWLPLLWGWRNCQAPTAVTNCAEVGECRRECPGGKVAGLEDSVMDAGEREGSGLKMFSIGRWFLRAEALY